MSQIINHTIPNSGGAAYRAAVNAYLQALISASSGPTAPSPTVAGMSWFDTTTLTLKVRNNANTAWVTVTPETIAASSFWGNKLGVAGALSPITVSEALTMLGLTSVLTTPYKLTVPPGMLLQAGTNTTGAGGKTITYPTAFSATAVILVAPNLSGFNAYQISARLPTATNFWVDGFTATGSQVDAGFSWFAMGPS